jgi:hypothetical protein
MLATFSGAASAQVFIPNSTRRQRVLRAVATALLLVPGIAMAETWQCEDATGHRYRAGQNVASDVCRKLDESELAQDPASIKLPPRSNPKWGIERFCNTQKACEPQGYPLEHGTLDGVAISLRKDGGLVEGAAPDGEHAGSGTWDISCRRDKMTSARSCTIYREDLWVGVYGNGRMTFSVGDEHFPGSQTSIKIGSRRFDTGQRDGYFGNAPQLVQLMKNGTPVVTRYMKWPYREWIDQEFVAHGLGTAVQVARWLVKNGELD